MNWIDIVSWVCLVGGAVFCVIGGIGLVRLPDLYTRTHAATITDTLGASLILIGLAVQAGPGLTALKLLMVLAFLLYTSPVGGHALVAAAYAGGVHADLDVPLAATDTPMTDRPADASEGTQATTPQGEGGDDGVSD